MSALSMQCHIPPIVMKQLIENDAWSCIMPGLPIHLVQKLYVSTVDAMPRSLLSHEAASGKRRMVVYYVRAAHAFSAGIICRHCRCNATFLLFSRSSSLKTTRGRVLCPVYPYI